jgi:hypothetical protein
MRLGDVQVVASDEYRFKERLEKFLIIKPERRIRGSDDAQSLIRAQTHK